LQQQVCVVVRFKPEQLVYVETNVAETKRLQEKIEMELKKKIAEWRVRYVTRWNRYCIQAFRRLLVQLVHDLDFVTDILSVKREVIFMMMMIIMIIIIIYL